MLDEEELVAVDKAKSRNAFARGGLYAAKNA